MFIRAVTLVTGHMEGAQGDHPVRAVDTDIDSSTQADNNSVGGCLRRLPAVRRIQGGWRSSAIPTHHGEDQGTAQGGRQDDHSLEWNGLRQLRFGRSKVSVHTTASRS